MSAEMKSHSAYAKNVLLGEPKTDVYKVGGLTHSLK